MTKIKQRTPSLIQYIETYCTTIFIDIRMEDTGIKTYRRGFIRVLFGKNYMDFPYTLRVDRVRRTCKFYREIECVRRGIRDLVV
jgi:hypothetical protein